MEINPGFLSVMVFLAITPLISLVAADLAWRRRPIPGAVAMTVLTLAAALWSLGYNLELYTPGLAGKVFWAEFRYVGIGLIPVAWFVFGLQFGGWGRLVNRRNIGLLMVIPVLTVFFAFSNELHGWIWSSITLQPGTYLDLLEVRHGFWFWISTLYAYGLIVAGTVLTLGTLGRSLPLYRWQFGLVFFGGAIPAFFNLMNLLGYSPFYGIDLTSAAFSISAFLLGIAFWRFNLFDVVTVARNAIFDNLEDAILVVDASGRVLDANQAGRKIAHLPPPSAVNIMIDQVKSPALDPLRKAAAEDGLYCELTLNQEDQMRWYELRSTPLHDQTLKFVGRLVVWHEITALKQVEEKLRHLSLHDRLTGLYNRLYFEEEITRLSRGRAWPIAILVGDLDGLKAVNDSQGHTAGDDLILRAADVLRNSLRSEDVVARVGGDEFAALLPNASDADAQHMVDRIRSHESADRNQHPDAPVNFSLGLAIAGDSDDLRAIYQQADRRMYEQKKGRKTAASREQI